MIKITVLKVFEVMWNLHIIVDITHRFVLLAFMNRPILKRTLKIMETAKHNRKPRISYEADIHQHTTTSTHTHTHLSKHKPCLIWCNTLKVWKHNMYIDSLNIFESLLIGATVVSSIWYFYIDFDIYKLQFRSILYWVTSTCTPPSNSHYMTDQHRFIFFESFAVNV